MAWRGRRNYFRTFRALQDVSVEVRRGETLGIIGRNGAGKSTLLQLICGVLTPTFGAVDVNGRIAALLELGTGFNPEFTGRDNLAINAAILGLSVDEIAARSEAICAFADIGEFIDQPVKTYSSGMYVRLAFAIAIHVSPDILIIDEALAVGDAFFQAKCTTRIKRMLDDGVTLLFTSHDIAAVKALCSRVLWLDHGTVRALGPTGDVAAMYAREWVEEANAAQGMNAGARSAHLPPADVSNTVAMDSIAFDASRSGTGAARFTHVSCTTEAGRTDRIPAAWGSTMTIRARLAIVEPCSMLVVSYHIKDSRHQHLLGGHSARHAQLYHDEWAPGAVVDVTFRQPLLLHAGRYSLTVLVATIGDVAQYTDAVFLDWVDDAGLLTVAPRPVFPLSDLVEVENEVEVMVVIPAAESTAGDSG
jgi:lipopolysaccharide transport system ATP-binding protein